MWHSQTAPRDFTGSVVIFLLLSILGLLLLLWEPRPRNSGNLIADREKMFTIGDLTPTMKTVFNCPTGYGTVVKCTPQTYTEGAEKTLAEEKAGIATGFYSVWVETSPQDTIFALATKSFLPGDSAKLIVVQGPGGVETYLAL